ncbi:MAG: permease-like cell division protein FtsX [bacterium]
MRQLFFFIGEAFLGIKRSFLMAGIAVVTITLSLVVLGVFLLISVNLNRLSDEIVSKLELRLFLKKDLSLQQIQQLSVLLDSHVGIKELFFLDKKEAWAQFQLRYPQLALATFVQKNPLSHSFQIFLKPQQDLFKIARELQDISPFIDEIVYGGGLAKQIEHFSLLVRVIGVFLVCVLTLATLMIVVNTIRLTVMIRENEIDIMALVGAGDSFIRVPFLLEGLFLGFMGALSASVILNIFFGFFLVKVQANFPYFPLFVDKNVFYQVYLVLMITGSFLGLLGAYLSISKTLDSKKINS